MRTYFMCMQCQVEEGTRSVSSISRVRIPDDGVIEATCKRGHQTFTIVQQFKFELLSDMAITAIVDGYYRDAVASFAGALERLHEFFFQTTCRKQGVCMQTFERAWKEMSSQSERQLGAFIGTYLVETGGLPKLLHQNQTKFRNNVIHKGSFPVLDDTIQFGQAVVECALPILRLLKSDSYSAVVQTLVMESISNRSTPASKAGQRMSTQSVSTFLSLTNANEQIDVTAAIDLYSSRPNLEAAVEISNWQR